MQFRTEHKSYRQIFKDWVHWSGAYTFFFRPKLEWKFFDSLWIESFTGKIIDVKNLSGIFADKWHDRINKLDRVPAKSSKKKCVDESRRESQIKKGHVFLLLLTWLKVYTSLVCIRKQFFEIIFSLPHSQKKLKIFYWIAELLEKKSKKGCLYHWTRFFSK